MKGCSESTDTNRRHKNCERLTLRHDDTEQQRDRNPSVILLLSERVSVCVSVCVVRTGRMSSQHQTSV